jgi:hypothetical protein
MGLDVRTQQHIFVSAIIRLEEHPRIILWTALSYFSVHQAKHAAFAKETGLSCPLFSG